MRRAVRRSAPHAAVVLGLLVLGLLARAVHLPGSTTAVVWPSAGVALLWLAGRRGWPARSLALLAVVLVTTVVCWVTGDTLVTSVLGGVADATGTLVCLVVVELLQRGPLRLRHWQDLWSLALACLAGATASALLGTPLPRADDDAVPAVVVWLASVTAGSLLVSCVALRHRSARTSPARADAGAGPVEAVALWLTTAAAFVGVFVLLDGVQLAFATIPLAVLAALRLRSGATSALLVVTAATAVTGTVLGRGPFAPMPPELAVGTAGAYVAVMVLVVCSIAVHRDERAALLAELDAALAQARGRSALSDAVHQAVSHAIVVFAADGEVLESNRAADALLGGATSGPDGTRHWEDYTCHHLDGSPVADSELPVVRALSGTSTVGAELVALLPDHPEGRLLRIDAHPLPDVEGAAWSRGAVTVFHDATDERAEAVAAARTRDLLSGVLDGATELGVVALDLQGRITVFSSGAERLLGWSAAEVVGGTAQRFVRHAEVHERAAALGLPPGLESVLHGLGRGGSLRDRWTCVRRDGTTFTGDLTTTRMHDEDGDVVGTIGVLTDVTAQIAAEQRLADSEEQFRLAFETAPTGMLVMSLDAESAGLITRVNDAFAELAGRDRDELVGGRVRHLLHPDDVADHVARLEAISHGHPFSQRGLEQRFVRPDGSVRLGVTTPSLIRPADGSAPHLLVLVEDATERREAARALEHAALHDPLTGLPNRALLSQRLRAALEEAAGADDGDTGVAVLFLDLDGFKPVNDRHGHAAGDVLLREVALRLQRTVRQDDTVARLGGDEFAIVCPGLLLGGLETLVRRLQAAVAAPVVLDGGARVRVSASIGTATAAAADAGPGAAERLLDEADHQMYAVKRRRRPPAAPRSGAVHEAPVAGRAVADSPR